jgi:hypothetical protein
MALYYLYTLGRSALNQPVMLLWLFACIALSAGFGVFQISLYRRDNDWLYLLHRPLSSQQVFLALILAGCCVALVITLVPLLLIVLVMDANPLFGIESRHYRALPYALLTALCSYFCGCFALLSSNRLGFFALSMTTALVMINIGGALWSAALLLALWGFLLARVAFKPDLSRPPRNIGTLLLTELPIQYGCLWLIVLTATLFQGGSNYISGKDPARNPPPGTDYYVRALPPKEVMQLALDHSSHADAEFLRQQVALGAAENIGGPSFNSYPKRHQMPRLDEALVLNDVERNVTWHFSHDSMLFEGHESNTAAFMGWLGPDGFQDAASSPPAARFTSVPWTSANEYILGDHDIYQIAWDAGELHHRYHNTDGNRFNNSLMISEDTASLFADHALYLFSSAELRDATVALRPRAVLPLPAIRDADLRRVAILPLVDGYLVSALLDLTSYNIAQDFALIGRAHLQLFRLRQDHHPELLSDTPLPTFLGDVFRYRELVLAPGMRLFTDLMWGLRNHKSAEMMLPLLYVQFPLRVWLATAFVMLSSAGITAALLRRSALPLRIRLFWIVANGITGYAGLLSFFFGYYWKRQDELMIPPSTVDNPHRSK